MQEINRAFWQKLSKDLGNTLQRDLLNEAAIRAVRFSKERFRQKNWVDTTPQPWAPRKRKNKGTLMVATGRLKRSIRVINKTATSVTIGTDVPYARIHNEGGIIKETVHIRKHTRKRSTRQTRGKGRIAVKAHSRKMNTKVPERPFIGESQALLNKIERKMDLLIKKTLNKR